MFYTNAVGTDSRHRKGEIVYHYEKRQHYILIYTRSAALFRIEEEEISVKKGTLLLISPDKRASYTGVWEGYCDDWINFCDPDKQLANFRIPINKPVSLQENIPVSQYLQLMVNAYRSGMAQSDRVLSQLLMALFTLIDDYMNSSLPQIAHYQKLLELREEIYASPARPWSIQELADQVSLSAAYFQDLYKKAFQVSCGADIIQSRIEQAKRMLAQTNLTMEEIADRCGYNSPVHFSRQFRKCTGCAPSKWRENAMGENMVSLT
jgi:AraC family transcriptional regulator, arabinose operon regulatory protein